MLSCQQRHRRNLDVYLPNARYVPSESTLVPIGSQWLGRTQSGLGAATSAQCCLLTVPPPSSPVRFAGPSSTWKGTWSEQPWPWLAQATEAAWQQAARGRAPGRRLDSRVPALHIAVGVAADLYAYGRLLRCGWPTTDVPGKNYSRRESARRDTATGGLSASLHRWRRHACHPRLLLHGACGAASSRPSSHWCARCGAAQARDGAVARVATCLTGKETPRCQSSLPTCDLTGGVASSARHQVLRRAGD